MSPKPVVIVGAGITGLVLAQALAKRSVPFVIYERDPDALFRGKGWGITIHWALNSLLDLLPQAVIDRLPEAYVDGEATKNGENGNFLFFNLRTAQALWQVPPSRRIRMSREKFRRVLMDGIPINWDYTFQSFEESAGGVSATFATPSGSQTVEGSMLVGCDGARSLVRSSLFPDPAVHSNYSLPVRLLGASTIYPGSMAAGARALDPFFFQGGDPETNAAHWFSFLDSPSSSGRGDDSRDCQILVSWPYRANFMGREAPLEVPAKGAERIHLMKSISAAWSEPFRSIFESLPEEADVKTISLEDWVPPKEGWTAQNAVLVGDSAHAMTMYRGEAANHGIADVHLLVSQIVPVLQAQRGSLALACQAYTAGMVDRAAPAVKLSRQACLDAHVYERIDDGSPLMMKRAVGIEPAVVKVQAMA